MEPEAGAAFFRIANLDVLGRDAGAQVGQIEIGIDSEVERSLVGCGAGWRGRTDGLQASALVALGEAAGGQKTAGQPGEAGGSHADG